MQPETAGHPENSGAGRGAGGRTRDPDRQPVDADIELVVAFLNTYDAETDVDQLLDAEHWLEWCRDRQLGEAPEADTARAIRDQLRGSISEGTGADVSAEWPLRFSLHPGAPTLTSDDALGRVLVAALRLAHTGHWERIKICPAHNCRWVFYDRSRNRSRTWCAMRVCGNRSKARSWRQRRT